MPISRPTSTTRRAAAAKISFSSDPYARQGVFNERQRMDFLRSQQMLALQRQGAGMASSANANLRNSIIGGGGAGTYASYHPLAEGGAGAGGDAAVLSAIAAGQLPITPEVQSAMLAQTQDPLLAEYNASQTNLRQLYGGAGFARGGGGYNTAVRQLRAQTLSQEAKAGRDTVATAAMRNFEAQLGLGQLGQQRYSTDVQAQIARLGLLVDQNKNQAIGGPAGAYPAKFAVPATQVMSV